MDWWLLLAVILYFLCAALLIAEVFVPSGGIISICALVCLIGGVAIFFNHSMAAGYVGIGLAIVMIPTVVVLAYKYFPVSRFGRSVTLTPSEREVGDAIPDNKRLQSLMGQMGVVVTPLRPVGMCEFSGERVECVAESGYVDRDTSIEVVRVQGTQLTVRVSENVK